GTHNIIVAMELVLEHHEAFVFIEDPNLRKWYGKNAEAKQQGAGSIKRDYSVWTTFFNHYKIQFAPVAPRNVGSLPPQVIKKLTGKGRTSVHERDAICMALRKPVYDWDGE